MLSWLLLAAGLACAAQPPRHPLEPLSAAEIDRAVEAVRRSGIFSPDALFPVLNLREPSKEELSSGSPRREVFAVVFDRARNETSEAIVDLGAGKLTTWRVVPAVQPMILVDELLKAPEIVRDDPRWQEAMRKRGITDFATVQVHAWAPGALGPPDAAAGPRLLRGLSFLKGGSSNSYGRPIEGVSALLDMNKKQVLELVDTGVVAVSPEDGSFHEGAAAARPALKPFKILQPKGPDVQFSGNELRWQKWSLRFSMQPREGLVLHTVGYEDQGAVRPVLHRAALSEMVVPYGDPRDDWARRNAFEVGEYGLGKLAAPLEPGVDVPENAALFDAVLADEFGKPYTLKNAIAVFERDGGMLWKHYALETGKNESRRGRELVVAAVATIGSYDYGTQWVLRQDGSIEFEALLTGITLAQGVSTGAAHEPYAHLVAPGVAAPHRQHFFSVRLDLDVDGAANTACELDTRALPHGKLNPHGNAIAVDCRLLPSEKQARRDLNPASGRKWLVQSAEKRNAFGAPTGFLLAPGENTPPFQSPKSLVRQRAGFIDHQFWITAYKPEELYAAGEYPNQNRAADGLPRWTADDEPLVGRDLVLWYTMGLTQLPRPEEWPVMPVRRLSFKLLPAGFFTRNPALDLPRPRKK